MTRLSTRTELWLWHPKTGKGSWHFLTIDGEAAETIRAEAVMRRLELGLPKKRGWGAIKVEVTIGDTVWRTSVFPESDGEGYLLPIKAAVRKTESLSVGDMVDVAVELV